MATTVVDSLSQARRDQVFPSGIGLKKCRTYCSERRPDGVGFGFVQGAVLVCSRGTKHEKIKAPAQRGVWKRGPPDDKSIAVALV